MWQLWTISQAYGVRPSQVMGIPEDDTWCQFQLDMSVLRVGRHVERRMAKGEEVNLQTLYSGKEDKPRHYGQYRSPIGLVRGKARIPASGIW